MKIAYIATYPPRECGIGTFTWNLYNSMVMNNRTSNASIEGLIVALNDHELTYNYPEEVKLTIRQEHQRDYLSAVKFINLSGADICILEHEFGIYGGQNGVYILPLLHRLEHSRTNLQAKPFSLIVPVALQRPVSLQRWSALPYPNPQHRRDHRQRGRSEWQMQGH